MDHLDILSTENVGDISSSCLHVYDDYWRFYLPHGEDVFYCNDFLWIREPWTNSPSSLVAYLSYVDTGNTVQTKLYSDRVSIRDSTQSSDLFYITKWGDIEW